MRGNAGKKKPARINRGGFFCCLVTGETCGLALHTGARCRAAYRGGGLRGFFGFQDFVSPGIGAFRVGAVVFNELHFFGKGCSDAAARIDDGGRQGARQKIVGCWCAGIHELRFRHYSPLKTKPCSRGHVCRW